MKLRCTTGKKAGAIRTSCKYTFLAISFFLALFTAKSVKAEAEAKKMFEIKSTFENSFEQPSNFAIDSKGNVYILEDLKERVIKFSKTGKYLTVFGNATNTTIDIYKAYSITCDDYDLIHIFQAYNSSILTFSPDGELKKTLPLAFNDDLEHKITDIAFSYNSYYLLDNEYNHLYIFDMKGNLKKKVGKKGELLEQFKSPFSMSFDLEGRIFITDVLNSRVQAFTSTGAFIKQISGFGFTDGGVFRPNGIAVDDSNNIYVSDPFLGIISVFDKDGTYVSPLMEDGKVIKLKTPTRLKIFNGRLYVLEMLKSTISIYDIL